MTSKRPSIQEQFASAMNIYNTNVDDERLYGEPDSPFGIETAEPVDVCGEVRRLAADEFRAKISLVAPALTAEQVKQIEQLGHDFLAYPMCQEFRHVVWTTSLKTIGPEVETDKDLTGEDVLGAVSAVIGTVRCDGRVPLQSFKLPSNTQRLTIFEKILIDNWRDNFSQNALARMLGRSTSTINNAVEKLHQAYEKNGLVDFWKSETAKEVPA